MVGMGSVGAGTAMTGGATGAAAVIIIATVLRAYIYALAAIGIAATIVVITATAIGIDAAGHSLMEDRGSEPTVFLFEYTRSAHSGNLAVQYFVMCSQLALLFFVFSQGGGAALSTTG
jgi:hypothetical protein